MLPFTSARRALSTLTMLVLFTGSAPPAEACTIFRITLDGRTYMGNNEAWNDPNTKVWFLPAEDRRGAGGGVIHGRVIFGYRNGYAQGGMNDQGLSYDWVAGYTDTQWQRDASKPDFTGNLGEKMLEEVGTVEEAITLLSTYNDPDFATARTLIADRTGASAVVGFRNGALFVERSTGPCQSLGWEEEATQQRLEQMASAAPDSAAPTSDAARISRVHTISQALGACRQSGAYTTLYSNVYDLAAGEVWVYQYGKDLEPVKFTLADELAKGSHYYDLPDVREELTQDLKQDGRSLQAVALDPAEGAAIAGTYQTDASLGGLVLTFTAEKDKMLVTLPGEEMGREIFASEKLHYFLRIADIQFIFTAGATGGVESVTVKTWETTFSAQRRADAESAATAPGAGSKDAAAATEPVMLAADMDRLSGAVWHGTLTYKDYTSGQQVSIPSSLSVTAANDAMGGWQWAYGYDAEPQANEAARYVLAEGGRELLCADEREKVIARTQLPDGVQLTLESQGKDDDRPATIQRLIEIRSGEVTIRKMVRLNGEAEFFERHSYHWTR